MATQSKSIKAKPTKPTRSSKGKPKTPKTTTAKRPKPAKAGPKSIDEYIAAVKDDQRAALQKIRTAILSAAPGAEEYIAYGLAAFKLHGTPLVAFGASPAHCAFYPMSNSTVAAHQEELRGYSTSTGTIRFAGNKPLPPALVKKLVKARIAENAARSRKPSK